MDASPDLQHVTLAVLAGGRGERMGRPKSELHIGKVPILDWLHRTWNWPGPTLLITAAGREHPPGAERFDREQVDPPSTAVGPLRGVHTALLAATTPVLFLTTVDMPCIRRSHAHWMIAQLHARPACWGLMLSRAEAEAVQVEPFPFACRIAAEWIVEARLAGSRHSVVGLSASPGLEVLPAPAEFPAEMWTNLNFPADYAAFIASLGPSAV